MARGIVAPSDDFIRAEQPDACDTLRYGVERVGALNAQTIVTGLLGGNGFNLATLEGDGKAILQSMTIDSLAHAIVQHAHLGHDEKASNPLGSLFGG